MNCFSVHNLLANQQQSMLPYCEISCHTMDNIQIPILLFIQDYFKDPSIRIIPQDVTAPAMNQINTEDMKNIADKAKDVRIDEDMEVDEF
ncbi:MAG: hypothetical protein MHMPM18_001475 [Marteilia pararefringens]